MKYRYNTVLQFIRDSPVSLLPEKVHEVGLASILGSGVSFTTSVVWIVQGRTGLGATSMFFSLTSASLGISILNYSLAWKEENYNCKESTKRSVDIFFDSPTDAMANIQQQLNWLG